MSARDKTARLLCLRPLPVVAVVILGATVIPVELRHPSLAVVSWAVHPLDALRNLFLFAPVGFALGRPLRATLGICALSSIAIEVLQFGFAGRQPSPADVAANVLGGALGVGIFRIGLDRGWWSGSGIPVGRGTAAAAVLAVVLLLFVLSVPGPATDFSGWDPDCRLAIGDELTLDRTWDGSLLDMAIYATALDIETIRDLIRHDAPAQREDGPAPVLAVGGSRHLTQAFAGQPILDPAETANLMSDLQKNGELTILARFRTSNLEQTGPARIVTLSKNPRERNFTLAQELRAIEFRLRTPASGPNGNEPGARSPAVLHADRDVSVAASFDGRVSRIYLDGRLVARSNLASSGRPGKPLLDYGAPTAAVLIGTGAAVAAVGLRRARSTRARTIVASIAGFVAGLLLVAVGGLDALPSFAPWSVVLATVAGAVVGLAAHDAV